MSLKGEVRRGEEGGGGGEGRGRGRGGGKQGNIEGEMVET